MNTEIEYTTTLSEERNFTDREIIEFTCDPDVLKGSGDIELVIKVWMKAKRIGTDKIIYVSCFDVIEERLVECGDREENVRLALSCAADNYMREYMSKE